jgi:hypothetical protein
MPETRCQQKGGSYCFAAAEQNATSPAQGSDPEEATSSSWPAEGKQVLPECTQCTGDQVQE